jgi:Tfp pilus assembly protein PilN
MRAVNLLPREATGRGSINPQHLPALVGGGVGFLVVAALAGGYLSASSKVAAAQRQLTAAQKQLAQTPVPPTVRPQVNTTPSAVTAQEAPRLQAVSSVLSQRIAWDRILREFSLVLPNDVWINSLTMAQPSATGPGNFEIQGTTYSYDSVARMLARISLVPDLANAQLSSTTGSGRTVQFNITAAVKGGAAPAAPAAAAPAAPAPSTDTTSTDTTSATDTTGASS